MAACIEVDGQVIGAKLRLNAGARRLQPQSDLTLDAPVEGGFSAEIRNLIGQTVWQSRDKIETNNLKIEVSAWQSGFYILTLTDNVGGKWSRQFVKL